MNNKEQVNDSLSEDKSIKREQASNSSSNWDEAIKPEGISLENATESKSGLKESDEDGSKETQSANTLAVSNSKPNKAFTFLKTKLGIGVVSAILIVVVLAIVFVKKYTNEKTYEKNLKEFVIESSKSSMASAYVCDDLRKVWQEYIFDDKEYFNRTTGSFTTSSYNGDEYCSDFSEAVNRKIRWNEEHLSSELNAPYSAARHLYKEMTPPPGKYKEIHAYVKQMFKAMEKLHELSENPQGNLSSYSSDCNTATYEFTSALSDLTNECDIDLSAIDK